MREASRDGTPNTRARGKHGSEPTLQIICLASGGGPAEDNVTGFLVRALDTKWSKQSVLAVDAGSHLASITRLLQSDFPLVTDPSQSHNHTPHMNGTSSQPPTRRPPSSSSSATSISSRSSSPDHTQHGRALTTGPFADLYFPHQTARANALHIVRDYVSTYLITHPHLDHIAAFAMNTAAFHATSRPKRLAALPSTVNAIKTHIFNDIIWPNLTDEDGGVGFVTFQRLTEGGNLAVGEGRGKGYIEVCDGLCVKGLKISHGHCTRSSSSALPTQAAEAGLSEAPPPQNTNRGRPTSMVTGPNAVDAQSNNTNPPISPTNTATRPDRSMTLSISGGSSAPTSDHPNITSTSTALVVDSTAYFIRSSTSPHSELLVFGDVEPDSLSHHPRNSVVWAEAAPKIVSAHLRAIVIECSYDDGQGDAVLFGHLCPRHVVRELAVLAGMVKLRRAGMEKRRMGRKRKRLSSHFGMMKQSDTAESTRAPSLDPESYASVLPSEGDEEHDDASGVRKRSRASGSLPPTNHDPNSTISMSHAPTFPPPPLSSTVSRDDTPQTSAPPLAGVTILINHVKDNMKDGPLVGNTISRQLREHEAMLKEVDGVGLGCEFVVSKTGGCYYF